MLDLEYLKQFREIKDIEDIIQDIEKLNSSIYWNDWNEVNQHIQKVSIATLDKGKHDKQQQNGLSTLPKTPPGCKKGGVFA